MTSTARRAAGLVAAVAAALSLALAGTAAANDGGGAGASDCRAGRAVGAGATPLNSFAFTVCRHSGDLHDATGYFEAAAPAPANAVVAPKGPVTCADIRGNVASFYYPFGPGSMPPPNPAFTGIMIVAVDGGATGDSIGFSPVVAGANADCSQGSPTVVLTRAAAVPVTSGSITVTG